MELVEMPVRQVTAAAEEEYSCEFGSNKYFALCAFGGVLSCGITHTAVTPLDLVKCRLQVNKEKYKNLGNGFKVTVAEQGVRGLFLGWAPTALGYSAQGLCKFGFYEFFKNVYANLIGEENTYEVGIDVLEELVEPKLAKPLCLRHQLAGPAYQ